MIIQNVNNINTNSIILSLIQLKNNKIVAGFIDGFIKIYNSYTFIEEQSIKIHNNWINYIIQLTNENIVTCSEDKTIKIIFCLNKKNKNDNNNNNKNCFINFFNKIKQMKFNNNNNNNYSILHTLKGHKDSVEKIIEFNYTNDIISCSKDKTIKIWKIKKNNSYSNIYTFNENLLEIWSILLIKSNILLSINKVIFSINKEDCFINFYDLNLKKKIKFITNILISENNQAQIIFNNDLYIGGFEGVYIIDTISYNIKDKIIINGKNNWINCILNIDKENILFISNKLNYILYNINNKNIILVKKKVHKIYVSTIIKLSNNNKYILSGSKDRYIKLWEII